MAPKSKKSVSLKTKLKREIEELQRTKFIAEQERKKRKEEKLGKHQKVARLDQDEQKIEHNSTKSEEERIEIQSDSIIDSQGCTILSVSKLAPALNLYGIGESEPQQTLATEKRRQEQREILRKQAAALRQKSHLIGSETQSNNSSMGSPNRTRNFESLNGIVSDRKIPNPLATPERNNISQQNLNKISNSQSSDVAQQREVLKRHAEVLLTEIPTNKNFKQQPPSSVQKFAKTQLTAPVEQKKLANDEHCHREQQGIVATNNWDLVQSIARDEQVQTPLDEHRRMEQREILQRQANELLQKQEREAEHGSSTVEYAKIVSLQSPLKSVTSPSVGSVRMDEEHNNENDNFFFEMHESTSSHTSSISKKQKLLSSLSFEQKKTLADEKRRKEQREVLRRQAAELLESEKESSVSSLMKVGNNEKRSQIPSIKPPFDTKKVDSLNLKTPVKKISSQPSSSPQVKDASNARFNPTSSQSLQYPRIISAVEPPSQAYPAVYHSPAYPTQYWQYPHWYPHGIQPNVVCSPSPYKNVADVEVEANFSKQPKTASYSEEQGIIPKTSGSLDSHSDLIAEAKESEGCLNLKNANERLIDTRDIAVKTLGEKPIELLTETNKPNLNRKVEACIEKPLISSKLDQSSGSPLKIIQRQETASDVVELSTDKQCENDGEFIFVQARNECTVLTRSDQVNSSFFCQSSYAYPVSYPYFGYAPYYSPGYYPYPYPPYYCEPFQQYTYPVHAHTNAKTMSPFTETSGQNLSLPLPGTNRPINQSTDSGPNLNQSSKVANRKRSQFTNAISVDVLKHPSPFSTTHVVVEEPIILVRKEEESFGVTVSLVMESVLVALVSEKIASVSEKIASGKANLDSTDKEVITATAQHDLKDLQFKAESLVGLPKPVVTRRKRRRKRVFFGALMVADPSLQNSRRESLQGLSDVEDPTFQSELKLVQKGDLLLRINDFSTEGLPFAAACELFKKSPLQANGFYKCTLHIARLKPPPKKVIPRVIQKTSTENWKSTPLLPLSITHSISYALSLLRTVLDVNRRLIGSALADDDLLQHMTATDLSLTQIPLELLKAEWIKKEKQLLEKMQSKHSDYWATYAAAYPYKDDAMITDSLMIADSTLSGLRCAPRPTDGKCRCGSLNHQYVNDPKCILYRALRALDTVTDSDTKPETKVKDGSKSKQSQKDLSTIEKASTDRSVRLIEEWDAEVAEAKFVAKMEKIQIQICNQAVFAPTLETMVLSAVAELNLKFKDVEFSVNNVAFPSKLSMDNRKATAADEGSHENVSEDEADDIPLALLRAKRLGEPKTFATKRKRSEFCIRYHFLATLVVHISKKWGHVYHEPSDLEYAWRWEMFHGQNSVSGSRWSSSSKNPRKAGSLSLERVRMVFNDDTLSEFGHDQDEDSHADAMQALAFILSPQQTGICDELLSLLRTEVLKIDDEKGIFVLSDDWYTKVDFSLLADMHLHWGRSVDPEGKYGIIEELQSLESHWERTDEGWLSKDDNEMVFFFDELDEWRQVFEQKHQSAADGLDGIGRFS